MTEMSSLNDLDAIRRAVERRDRNASVPAPILCLWGIYVLIGYPMLDFLPNAAPWFLLIGGIVGGVISMYLGKAESMREGERDRAQGLRHALHWGSIFLGIAAVVALGLTHRAELGNGSIIGQLIVLVIGLVYFLGGVHFDRYFLFLGVMLMAGSVGVGFIPRFPWTILGVLLAAALVLPAVLRKRSVSDAPIDPSAWTDVHHG